MRARVREEVIRAVRDGQITDLDDRELYPRGWLERADDLDEGRAVPGDWQNQPARRSRKRAAQ